jgi:hypothetical protein
MTTRKADLRLASRVTAFVTRESGAAELQISPSTWDEMEKCGQLPKPYLLGPRHDLKRWWWPQVIKRIVGAQNPDDDQAQEPYFRRLALGQTSDH